MRWICDDHGWKNQIFQAKTITDDSLRENKHKKSFLLVVGPLRGGGEVKPPEPLRKEKSLWYKKNYQNLMKHKKNKLKQKLQVMFSHFRSTGKGMNKVSENMNLNLAEIFLLFFLYILDHFQAIKEIVKQKWFWTRFFEIFRRPRNSALSQKKSCENQIANSAQNRFFYGKKL